MSFEKNIAIQSEDNIDDSSVSFCEESSNEKVVNTQDKLSKIIKSTAIVFGVLLLILIAPAIVSFLMERSWMNWGTQKSESWMGFWGGYLGAILGIIGAITATTIQIKSQTNQIVIAAKKNDELERNRIHSNFIIDKNDELYKKIIELKRDVNQMHQIVNDYLLACLIFLKNNSNTSISKSSQDIDNEKLLSHSIESLCTSIKSYQIFIDENSDYKKKINLLINEIEFFNIDLSNPFSNEDVFDSSEIDIVENMQNPIYDEIESIKENFMRTYLEIDLIFINVEKLYLSQMQHLMNSSLNNYS